MGERILHLRSRRHMTQQELADAAEVSVDLVRKLEQQQRDSARLTTLNQLARALDVPVGELINTPRGLATDAQDGEMFHLRRVLLGCVPDARPATTVELEIATSRAWELYYSARFGEMARELPNALAAAYSAMAIAKDPAKAKLSVAQLLWAAGNLLGYVAHEDLAALALMRADVLAAEAGDELTRAAIGGTQAWLLMKNAMFDDAVARAEETATNIEPRLSTASPRQISIWGELLCYAAFAASNAGSPNEARRYLRLAESAGSQLDDVYRGRPELSNVFGPTSAAAYGIVNEVAAERPTEALKLARGIEGAQGVPPMLSSRRLVNIAHAQVENWDNVAAVNTLRQACAVAPEFVGHIALAHTLTNELLTRRRKQRLPGLSIVARQVGVAS